MTYVLACTLQVNFLPFMGKMLILLGSGPFLGSHQKNVETFLTRPKDKFVHADPTRSIERRNYGSPPS